MINRLIKNFTFTPDVRKDLIFSDTTKVRLNDDDQRTPHLSLKKDSKEEFPIDADIFVETPLTTPNALQKWLGFEAKIIETKNTFTLPVGTSLGFKLKTTGDDFYWDGAAWSVAGLSDWSTEAQINDNFDTFPIEIIGNKSIGVIINLKTTDPKVTPQVLEIKMLGEFDIEYLEDIVYDSVIRKLNTEFRSSSIVVFRTSGLISSIDLDTVLENKGYNITGIRKVVNLTADPLELTNLFDTYTPGPARQDGFTFDPGIVTFTSAIPISNLVKVTFEYVPEIMVTTGQDYFEVSKFPSIVFEAIEEVTKTGFAFKDTIAIGRDFIRNKSALTAVEMQPPTVKTIRLDYSIYTGLQGNQLRVIDDIRRFFSNMKTIKSFGLDCGYDVNIVDGLDTSKNKKNLDLTDTKVANGSFEILGVNFYDQPSKDQKLVGQINVDAKLVN